MKWLDSWTDRFLDACCRVFWRGHRWSLIMGDGDTRYCIWCGKVKSGVWK